MVNTHYLAPQIDAHLGRVRAESAAAAEALRVCHEPVLLETGGGIVNALPLLGEAPFFSANSDAFWVDGATPALARMSAALDPERMDALLMLVPQAQAVGYAGRGDFELDAAGVLSRSPSARYVFTGLQILHPRLFAGRAPGPFSLRELYTAALQPDGSLRGMFGLLHDGAWVHVGSAAELVAANAYLAKRH